MTKNSLKTGPDELGYFGVGEAAMGGMAVGETLMPVLHELNQGFEDAIKDEVLTPYNYHVVPVKLEEDEFEEYLSISSQISKLSFGGENLDNPSLTALLMKRSRLLGSARGKIIKLNKRLLSNKDFLGGNFLKNN